MIALRASAWLVLAACVGTTSSFEPARPVSRSAASTTHVDAPEVVASDADICTLEFGGYRVGDGLRRRIERSVHSLHDRAARQRSVDELAAANEADALIARVLASVHASSRM